MAVEKRFVLVGIRIDSQSRQLLNLALVKIAEPDYVSKNKSLIDGYLEAYEGLCDVKKVGLSSQIITGKSIKNILVREAKNQGALALVVGLILDPRPSLTSIDNLSERIIMSEFGCSLVNSEKSPHQNTKESKEDVSERHKSRSISMFAGDPSKKLGWPLLRKSNSNINMR